MSAAGFSVYLEYAACFPNRSGSEAVYLEQAYPRPRYLFPISFAVQTVALSFSSGNSVVMANYLFAIGDYEPSNWEIKGVAIACYTAAFLLVVFNTRFSYWACNGIGLVKLVTLVFISITGLVVLGGNTRVQNPKANFQNAFEGETTVYGATNALIKIIFSCMELKAVLRAFADLATDAGYENAFNVVNEVKVPSLALRANQQHLLKTARRILSVRSETMGLQHCLLLQYCIHSPMWHILPQSQRKTSPHLNKSLLPCSSSMYSARAALSEASTFSLLLARLAI